MHFFRPDVTHAYSQCTESVGGVLHTSTSHLVSHTAVCAITVVQLSSGEPATAQSSQHSMCWCISTVLHGTLICVIGTVECCGGAHNFLSTWPEPLSVKQPTCTLAYKVLSLNVNQEMARPTQQQLCFSFGRRESPAHIHSTKKQHCRKFCSPQTFSGIHFEAPPTLDTDTRACTLQQQTCCCHSCQQKAPSPTNPRRITAAGGGLAAGTTCWRRGNRTVSSRCCCCCVILLPCSTCLQAHGQWQLLRCPLGLGCWVWPQPDLIHPCINHLPVTGGHQRHVDAVHDAASRLDVGLVEADRVVTPAVHTRLAPAVPVHQVQQALVSRRHDEHDLGELLSRPLLCPF